MKYIITLCIAAILILSACDAKPDPKPGDRFVYTGRVFTVRSTIGSQDLAVIKDKETGILYLFNNSSHAGGLTPWLDSNGKPMKEDVGYGQSK